MPFIPPPPERMGDELIELRPIAEWDIPEVLIAHQDDRDLYRWLGMARPPSGAQLGREVELAQLGREVELADSGRQSGGRVKLTIVDRGGNDCRGRVEITDVDWGRGAATLRVWVAPQWRNRGYEQRAAELAADWLRSAVGLTELNVSLRL